MFCAILETADGGHLQCQLAINRNWFMEKNHCEPNQHLYIFIEIFYISHLAIFYQRKPSLLIYFYVILKQLTWLSLVMSMMVSFYAVLFPRGVLDEILNLIESVSEGFPSYSSIPESF